MKQHYVVYLSPGTFVHEETRIEIDSWDVDNAKAMAHNIVERHNARPFAFYFLTRGREANELDAKVIATSPKYFLGGKVETIEEVEARNDPEERILRSNMRCNGYNKIIVNTNSWKVTQPLQDDDVVLEWP